MLYGEDGFRVRERLKFYTDAFSRQHDPQDLSVARFYAPDFEINDLHRAINSPPLFAPKRLFIIYNFSKLKLDKSATSPTAVGVRGPRTRSGEEIILNDVKNLSVQGGSASGGKNNSIIFLEEIGEKDFKGVGFYKKIKLDSSEYFPYLKGRELLREVERKFEKNGIRIEPQALDRFLFLTGSDFWKINSEMEKLVNYVHSFKRRSVILRDVETAVLPETADNCFALIDYLSRKDKKNILREAEYLKKSGVSPETIFYQIGSHFRQILEAKTFLENKKPVRRSFSEGGIGFKAIAEVFHLHPYRAQKIHQAAANFTIDELRRIHNLILDLDVKIKTGKLKSDLALDLLVTNLSII